MTTTHSKKTYISLWDDHLNDFIRLVWTSDEKLRADVQLWMEQGHGLIRSVADTKEFKEE